MNLQTFDASNIIEQKRGDAIIHLSRTGVVSLRKDAVTRTGYEAGDMIAIHQDTEESNDWYISKSEEGFKLRDDKNNGSLITNSSVLCKMILDFFEIDSTSVAFFIGKEAMIWEDVEYWPIITAKPIIKVRRAKK